MSINLQSKEKTNLPEANLFSSSYNFNTIAESQNNNNLEQNLELIKNLNDFFSISSENISKSNQYLCNLITWTNSSSFTYALLNPLNFQVKIFASNALLYLFTNNYTEIEIEKAQTMFESLINYLFQHSQIFYADNNHINKDIIKNKENIMNESNNEKIFMNYLIKLVSRIIRVFFPQCNYFKKFDAVIINKANIYPNDSNNVKIIINIFTEVIYQFQTKFGLNKNIIQMTKYFGTLEEFKEGPLIFIFNYTCEVVANIIGHKIQTENFRDILHLSKQVVLCLDECLNYSEDSNIREEDYNKYEIKPTYIPSQRRRGKDKKLNINFLVNLCQNLFDLYNMILNTYISTESPNINNANNSNNNINGNNLDYFYVSEGVLKILNCLICMKIQYLDYNKGRILKCYMSSLGGILYNKHGYIHHEYFCQIIFRLKKNYNFIDLSNENETFWNLIFPYIDNSLNLINNQGDNNSIFSSDKIKINIIPSSAHTYLPGTLYLLHFLGYFSHNLNQISLNFQMKMKQFIVSVCKKLLEMDFSEYESDMDDICKGFGACAEGVYIQILEDIIPYIKNDYNNKNILNLCFKIKFGIEVLRNNYQYLQEKRLINKISDNELECFSEIDLSDDKPEINAVINYIKCIFNIMKDILNEKDINKSNNNSIKHFGLLSNTLLRFIKFFCKNFLSKYLNNSLCYLINTLLNNDDNKKENYPEDLIVFIFNILINFNVKIIQNGNINNLKKNTTINMNNLSLEDKLINHKIVLEILNVLYDNFTFETDYSSKICQFQSLNILNNSFFDNSISSKNLNLNGNNNNMNIDNDLSIDIEPSNESSSNKNSSSMGTSKVSTPQMKSSLLSSESIKSINDISKNSFSQKIKRSHFNYNNNFQVNKNNINIGMNNLKTINEKDEITINSVDVHLGKIRLNQDKLINILKDLFNRVILINSNNLSFKVKKHFIEFLFKIFFQCYLPFESAVSYFIDQLIKITANDITEYIYIINSMISSVTTQENFQILIDTLLPSIQTLCSSITSQTFGINNYNNDTLVSLKKMLKLIKDITDLEKSHIKTFSSNSQSPIQIFLLMDSLLDYYISMANNVNINDLITEHLIYLIQIKPISYIIQIYYNLFSFYIQAPLFINIKYTYMQKLFYKISRIIFSIEIKNLIGYCDKFKKLMKLLKIIYCDYIIQNYGLIKNINNIELCDINNFICDEKYIENIIKIIKYILNEDYLENQDINNNINNNNINDNTNSKFEKLKLNPITNSSENIRECFKDFNDLIYEWCKLYIQYIGDKKKENNNLNRENNEISQNNTILSSNNLKNNNNNTNPNSSIKNSTKILSTIFSDNNINSLLYDILLPILQGIVYNFYTSIEINNSLSKTVFILAYTFHEQYLNIFNGILTSKKIKQFYCDEEINNIKNYFQQLNNIQDNKILNNANNNLNGMIDCFYNIFREQLNDFSKKIQNIIISRRKDINNINNLDLNEDDMLI